MDRLGFTEAGPAQAPVIVLLHGGGACSWTWREHLDALKDRYHVIAPDMPRHRASADIGPFTMPLAAALVADLIRERAGGRAHVAGLSLGAQTLVQLIADAPEVVESAFASGCLARAIPGMSLLGGATAAYWPIRNARWLVKANMDSLGVPERYFDEFARDTRELTLEAMKEILAANAGFRPPAGLAAAGVRTLFTVGEREPKVMRASARDLAAAVPGSQARLVAGAIHNWPVAETGRYIEVLKAWVEGSELPSFLLPIG
jgi:pimeloyl-ACP methyl ester carboxylesterase